MSTDRVDTHIVGHRLENSRCFWWHSMPQVPSLLLRTPPKTPKIKPSLPPPSVLQLDPALANFMFLQRVSTEHSSAAASKATSYNMQKFTASVSWYSWGYEPFGENRLTYSIRKYDHLPYLFSEHPRSHRSSGSMYHVPQLLGSSWSISADSSAEANQLN